MSWLISLLLIKSSYGIYWKLITSQRMNFGSTRAYVNSLIKHAWTATKWS